MSHNVPSKPGIVNKLLYRGKSIVANHLRRVQWSIYRDMEGNDGTFPGIWPLRACPGVPAHPFHPTNPQRAIRHRTALLIANQVGQAVASWRNQAQRLGMREAEIDRMASGV
jgi:hypothetical protein